MAWNDNVAAVKVALTWTGIKRISRPSAAKAAMPSWP